MNCPALNFDSLFQDKEYKKNNSLNLDILHFLYLDIKKTKQKKDHG